MRGKELTHSVLKMTSVTLFSEYSLAGSVKIISGGERRRKK